MSRSRITWIFVLNDLRSEIFFISKRGKSLNLFPYIKIYNNLRVYLHYMFFPKYSLIGLAKKQSITESNGITFIMLQFIFIVTECLKININRQALLKMD